MIWDKFGRDRVLEFFHVENEPDEISGERIGIPELQEAVFAEAERILASRELGATSKLAGSLGSTAGDGGNPM